MTCETQTTKEGLAEVSRKEASSIRSDAGEIGTWNKWLFLGHCLAIASLIWLLFSTFWRLNLFQIFDDGLGKARIGKSLQMIDGRGEAEGPMFRGEEPFGRNNKGIGRGCIGYAGERGIGLIGNGFEYG